MRVALLTQYYAPEIGAPQVRLGALARVFASRGHEVQVLTAMPSYPAGRVLPDYGGLLRREARDGISIVRCWSYPTQSVQFGPRVASYLSFTMAASLVGTALLRRPDFLIVESPPLLLGLAGRWLSLAKRTRMIFNVSDLWPDSAVRLGALRAGGLAHRLSNRLEAGCYERAWLVSGQSLEIVTSISKRFPRCRTYHLSNGVDSRWFRPDQKTRASRATLGPEETCIALYAGLHGLAQGLDQLVEAGSQLDLPTDPALVLVGDGPEKAALVARAGQEKASRVRFLPARPHAEMPALVASAEIVVIPLRTHLPGAVPSKLYEAMASGRPVVLVAEGEAASIVKNHQAGIVVPPGDVGGLIEALRALAGDATLRETLGGNGRRAAEQHFDRDILLGRFAQLLEEELGTPPVAASKHGSFLGKARTPAALGR